VIPSQTLIVLIELSPLINLLKSLMKKIILSLLILVPFVAGAQSKKFELGFSVGNNGMFSEVKEDYYDNYFFQFLFFEPVEKKSSDLKYNLSARYFFSDNISGRLKIGYSKRMDEYDESYYYFGNYNVSQTVTNFNPSLCFSKNLDKFELMTGIEIPLMIVGDYEMKGGTEYDSVIYVSPLGYTKTTISGGFIWGVSSFIGVKYNFNSWIGISSEINYGLMFANVGDEITNEYSDLYETYTETSKAGFKKTYFSSPEVSLGVFVKFGGSKTAEVAAAK